MIRTNDGQALRATAPADIVHELNKIAVAPEKSDREFMRSSAGRILEYFGRKIRTDTVENYVADLFEFGFLTQDEGPVRETKTEDTAKTA